MGMGGSSGIVDYTYITPDARAGSYMLNVIYTCVFLRVAGRQGETKNTPFWTLFPFPVLISARRGLSDYD